MGEVSALASVEKDRDGKTGILKKHIRAKTVVLTLAEIRFCIK